MKLELGAVAALLAAAACGGAQRGGAAAEPAAAGGERADISSVREAMTVYTDGKGHLVALVEPEPEQQVAEGLRLFYGDGKTFHSVPVWSASSEGLKFEIGFNDPRIPASPAGSIKREEGKVVLSCYGTDVELTRLPEAEARGMIGGASFLRGGPARSPLALVHDGDRYLFVDVGEGAEGKYRVFSGEKGRMREIAVDEAKYDERENAWTFRTREGTLVAMRDPEQRSYTLTLGWQGKKESWSALERAGSWKLIWNELGVYRGRTPTPCDPMMETP